MNNQTNKFEETLNGKIDDSELIPAPVLNEPKIVSIEIKPMNEDFKSNDKNKHDILKCISPLSYYFSWNSNQHQIEEL